MEMPQNDFSLGLKNTGNRFVDRRSTEKLIDDNSGDSTKPYCKAKRPDLNVEEYLVFDVQGLLGGCL